jgi:hypothetical protein
LSRFRALSGFSLLFLEGGDSSPFFPFAKGVLHLGQMGENGNQFPYSKIKRL